MESVRLGRQGKGLGYCGHNVEGGAVLEPAQAFSVVGVACAFARCHPDVDDVVQG